MRFFFQAIFPSASNWQSLTGLWISLFLVKEVGGFILLGWGVWRLSWIIYKWNSLIYVGFIFKLNLAEQDIIDWDWTGNRINISLCFKKPTAPLWKFQWLQVHSVPEREKIPSPTFPQNSHPLWHKTDFSALAWFGYFSCLRKWEEKKRSNISAWKQN